MTRYRVRFFVPTEVVVEIETDDEETAADDAWPIARDAMDAAGVYRSGVAIFGDLDGIGAESVEEIA